MLNYQRPDVYRAIHKALRKALFDLSFTIGKTDYSDKSEIAQLKKQFDETIHLLNSHGEKEDTFSIPLLSSKRPGCTDHNEEEHLRIHLLIDDLQEQMLGLISSDPKDNLKQAWNFYYAFNSFVSEYLMHMQMEEIEITGLFYELCSDEEILGMTNKIIQSIPPSEMAVVAKYMLPSLLPSDRSAMMKHIRDTAPANAFNGMMGLCKELLSTKDYTKLEESLGVTVS